MLKKNQSKSDEKVLPLDNQKKPLPKPDLSLIQIAHKMYKKAVEPVKIKPKGSVKIKPKGSVGTKRHK